MVNKTILNIYPGTQNHGEANLIEFYTEKNYYIYTYIIMYIYKSVLYVTPRTVTRHSPLFMGILQARILEWIVMPSSRGIFLTQESNPGLPHCRWILLSPESPRKPIYMHNYQKMEQYSQFSNKWGQDYIIQCINTIYFGHGHIRLRGYSPKYWLWLRDSKWLLVFCLDSKSSINRNNLCQKKKKNEYHFSNLSSFQERETAANNILCREQLTVPTDLLSESGTQYNQPLHPQIPRPKSRSEWPERLVSYHSVTVPYCSGWKTLDLNSPPPLGNRRWNLSFTCATPSTLTSCCSSVLKSCETLQPQRLQHTRLLCPLLWQDSSSKNGMKGGERAVCNAINK